MNSAEAVVRRMGAADVERVMEIARSLGDAPHWTRQAYLDALDAGSNVARIALVASEAGVVEGFAIASLVRPQAELETIVVAKKRQRSGLGRRLMGALVVDLRQAGVVEILLEVRISNEAARGFYRRLGFGETGRRPRYYADPEEDAVLMSLCVAEAVL